MGHVPKPIPFQDIVIPAQSTVLVSFYGVGRWPGGFEAPNEFLPQKVLALEIPFTFLFSLQYFAPLLLTTPVNATFLYI